MNDTSFINALTQPHSGIATDASNTSSTNTFTQSFNIPLHLAQQDDVSRTKIVFSSRLSLSKHRISFTLKSLICLSALALSACTTYRDIPANSPEQTVLQYMGQPNYSCDKPDGTRRLIWTTQPNGQYAYATNVSKAGIADKVVSVLNNENFHKLDKGIWTQQDVVCEFGPPAETRRIGLGEKNEVVWTYRYKQINHWNNLMYVYFGRHGDKVTHYHSAPDPRYDPDNFLFFD